MEGWGFRGRFDWGFVSVLLIIALSVWFWSKPTVPITTLFIHTHSHKKWSPPLRTCYSRHCSHRSAHSTHLPLSLYCSLLCYYFCLSRFRYARSLVYSLFCYYFCFSHSGYAQTLSTPHCSATTPVHLTLSMYNPSVTRVLRSSKLSVWTQTSWTWYYSLSIHYLFTIYSLLIHCLFTSIHYLFTVYSLYIHHLFSVRSLTLHLFTVLSLRIH
jgi:hypothetical protein